MNEALWILGRGFGVAALVILTASVALGITTSRRWATRATPRFAVTEIHRRASLFSTLLVLGHVALLWADPESELYAVDTLVPFLNARSPLWWGLGTLALDLVALLAVTSLLRKHLPYAWWRGIHWLAYVCWPVAWLHAVGGGTDAGEWWLKGIAIGCLSVVAVAVIWRVVADDRPSRRRDEQATERSEGLPTTRVVG